MCLLCDGTVDVIGRSGGSVPLGGPEVVVDIVDSSHVGPPLLPALGQIQRTREIAKIVNHSVQAPTAMTIPGEQGHDNLALDRKRIVGVGDKIQSLITSVLQSRDGSGE